MIILNKREKILIQVLGAVIMCVLVYFAVVSPIIEYRKSISQEFETNSTRLKTLDALYDKYKQIKAQKLKYSSLLKNNRGVTSLIEQYASEANIINNKVYTRDHPMNVQNKYKKITTDVKFEGVDIRSIIKFLYKMENTGQIIKISYLRIHQALKGRDIYDIIIKFDSYTLQ